MKITIEFDNDKLPPPFRVEGDEGNAGLANLLSFIHKQLLLLTQERQMDEIVNGPYLEAFYDKQMGAGAGKKWIDAIAEHNEADVQLAKLLLDNMKVDVGIKPPEIHNKLTLIDLIIVILFDNKPAPMPISDIIRQVSARGYSTLIVGVMLCRMEANNMARSTDSGWILAAPGMARAKELKGME